MKGLTNKLVQLESRLVDAVVNVHDVFYPRFITAIASRRWLLGSGMKLFLSKCLSSPEYHSLLQKLLSCAVRKGMQDGLEAGFEHDGEGRQPADIDANDPSAGADFDSHLKAFRSLDFSLLSDLSYHKDFDFEDVMHFFRLDAKIAENLGLVDLQPSLEQLSVPKLKCGLVVGEAPLSLSLSVACQRAKKIHENVAIGQFALTDLFALMSSPFPPESLFDSEAVPSSELASMSTDVPSTSSVPPIVTEPFFYG